MSHQDYRNRAFHGRTQRFSRISGTIIDQNFYGFSVGGTTLTLSNDRILPATPTARRIRFKAAQHRAYGGSYLRQRQRHHPQTADLAGLRHSRNRNPRTARPTSRIALEWWWRVRAADGAGVARGCLALRAARTSSAGRNPLQDRRRGCALRLRRQPARPDSA